MDSTDYSAPAGPPLYTVTRVEDSSMVGPTGGFQRSKRVYFTLSNGTSSFVELPITGFTKDAVQNLIDQHVGDLLDVLNITGPALGPPPG